MNSVAAAAPILVICALINYHIVSITIALVCSVLLALQPGSRRSWIVPIGWIIAWLRNWSVTFVASWTLPVTVVIVCDTVVPMLMLYDVFWPTRSRVWNVLLLVFLLFPLRVYTGRIEFALLTTLYIGYFYYADFTITRIGFALAPLLSSFSYIMFILYAVGLVGLSINNRPQQGEEKLLDLEEYMCTDTQSVVPIDMLD